MAALSFTLIEAANEQGISDDDFRIRQEIVNEMEKIIQQPLPGIHTVVLLYVKIFIYFYMDFDTFAKGGFMHWG